MKFQRHLSLVGCWDLYSVELIKFKQNKTVDILCWKNIFSNGTSNSSKMPRYGEKKSKRAKYRHSLANRNRFVRASVTTPLLLRLRQIEFIYFFELIDFHKSVHYLLARTARTRRTRSANICEKCIARNAAIKRETYYISCIVARLIVVANIGRLRSSRRRFRDEGSSQGNKRFNMPAWCI